MIVFFCYYFSIVLWPQFRAISTALSDGMATIILICIGISLIGGFAVARNFAEAIATGATNVMIVLIRAFFSAIATFLRWLFRLIPRVYRGVRERLIENGSSSGFASFMGVITALLVVAIII